MLFAERPGSALGKDYALCRVSVLQHSANRASLRQHSAQSIHFAECWRRTLDKEHNLCRVSCHFAECFSQALGKRPSPFIPPSWPFFLPSVGLGARQSLCRVPDRKHLAKRPLPTLSLPSPICRAQHSAKSLPSAYVVLPSVSDTRQRRLLP
jgi:hypothetical protein